MRADLALILFVLALAGGIALLVLRKKRGGAPLLIGGIVLLDCAAALGLYHRISQIFKNCPLRFLIPS